MNKLRVVLLFNLSFAISNLNAAPDTNENIIIANVWINGVDKTTEALYLDQNGVHYVECNVFAMLNIKKELFKTNPTKPEFCIVSEAPVSSEFDEKLQTVKINLPAEYFLSYEATQDFNFPDKASFGAFLNYDLFYRFQGAEKEFNSLSEIGVFKDYWKFNSALIQQKEKKKNHFSRLNTAFEVEFPKQFSVLTVGDTTSIYNPALGSFRYGGVSFGTNFTQRPDFVYWNMPTLQGSAILPSTVDLLINGVSIYQQKVTPGYFTLQSGASIQQAGDAQIVVEDILGNRTVQNFPVYINNQLLKPKLNEYNVSMGKIRYNYETKGDDYREFFSNIYFRRGITEKTTLGFNAAYSSDISNLGLLWTQALSKYALLDMTAIGSDNHSESGYSVATSISRNVGNISVGLSGKYSDPEFRMLGYSDQIFLTKFESLAYINFFNIPYLNNINFNFIQRESYPNVDHNMPATNDKVVNLGFSRNIGQDLSFATTYFKEFGDQDNQGVRFSLSYSFDSRRNLYADYSTENESRLQLSGRSGSPNGFDYNLGVNRRQNETFYNAYGAYKTSVGDLNFIYDYNNQYENAQLNYRGGLVWLDKKLAFTKLVDDAFALVEVDQYKDIDVYKSLSPAGKTSKAGHLFIHDLLPYVRYDLSFDQNQLPMEDKIEFSNKKITPLNQRGYIVNFPVHHTKVIVVRLVSEDQQTFAAGSEVYINDSQEYYPIGADGTVYLYGLKPDEYTLTLKTSGGKSCRSTLDIPAAKLQDMAAKTNELVCQ